MSFPRFPKLLTLLFAVVFTCATSAMVSAQTGAPSSGGGGDDDRRPVPQIVSRDVAQTNRNRDEYVVSGPIGSANAAAAALQDVGATLISFRDLGALNRRVMVFDLGRQMDIAVARRLLEQVAPDQLIDLNHLYKFAQGPRLYASSLVGDETSSTCRLSRNQRIGLIDGLVNPGHPALQGAAIRIESALIEGQRPANGQHGTGVAALIVGEDPSGALSGFAPGAQLFAVNAFAQEHRDVAADVDRIGASLNWLLANDVRLINMSFTGPLNRVLEDLLAQSEGAGAIMIASAGNDGSSTGLLPAVSSSVIAVTAVDAGMRRYRSANWGGHIEFSAPGVDVYVARNNGGGYATGTSYASPIVTALAARLGATSVRDLRQRLRNHSLDLGDPGRDAEFGWGLVQNIGC